MEADVLLNQLGLGVWDLVRLLHSQVLLDLPHVQYVGVSRRRGCVCLVVMWLHACLVWIGFRIESARFVVAVYKKWSRSLLLNGQHLFGSYCSPESHSLHPWSREKATVCCTAVLHSYLPTRFGWLPFSTVQEALVKLSVPITTDEFLFFINYYFKFHSGWSSFHTASGGCVWWCQNCFNCGACSINGCRCLGFAIVFQETPKEEFESPTSNSLFLSDRDAFQPLGEGNGGVGDSDTGP